MSEVWTGLSRDSVLAIAVMAVITYAFRAGGYWLMGRVQLSARAEAGLAYLPGAVITALVLPSALEAGIEGVVGLIAVPIVMRIRPNLMLAFIAGVGTVWLLRQIF